MFYLIFMVLSVLLTGFNVHNEDWAWAAVSTLGFFFNGILFLKDPTV